MAGAWDSCRRRISRTRNREWPDSGEDLPANAQTGYYRATRFDWSGVVYSLQYKDTTITDRGCGGRTRRFTILCTKGRTSFGGPCSSVTVPSMNSDNWDGRRRNPAGDSSRLASALCGDRTKNKYDNYRLYEVVDPGSGPSGSLAIPSIHPGACRSVFRLWLFLPEDAAAGEKASRRWSWSTA